MRVAFLTNNLSPHGLDLMEHIASRVEELQVFVSAEEDDVHRFGRTWGKLNVTVQKSVNRLRLPQNAYGFWLAGELHLPYDTIAHMRRFAPDAILSGQFGMRTVLAALYRRWRPRTQLVLWATLSAHTETKRGTLRRLLRRLIVRNIDGAIVNGGGGEKYLKSLGYSGPIVHAPYAIGGKLFQGLLHKPTPGIFRLISTGRLIPGKGLVGFCQVLSLWCLRHPAVHVILRIVGDGPQRKILTEMSLPVNCSLELPGSVQREELAAHYHWADAYAFPTLGDEWGVVVNEAMLAGLPILGSIYSQAVVEIIREGHTGWLFDIHDRDTVYGALERCFGSTPSDFERMSKNVVQEVEKLSPQRIGDRIVEFLESCKPHDIVDTTQAKSLSP